MLLANFAATEIDGQIQINWQTVSELNNLGFNLYRATTASLPETSASSVEPLGGTEGGLIQLNPSLIPAQAPGSGPGGTYEWVDDNISAGITYYYWLEDVDSNGQTSLHGPVSATTTIPTAVTIGTLESKPPDFTGWLLGIMSISLLLGRIWHRR